MATKLVKPVEREVTITGVNKPVIVTMSPSGVTARIKGSKTILHTGWLTLVQAMDTPTDVPSHLYGKPLDLLKHKGK